MRYIVPNQSVERTGMSRSVGVNCNVRGGSSPSLTFFVSCNPGAHMRTCRYCFGLVLAIIVGGDLCGCRTHPGLPVIPIAHQFTPGEVSGAWIGFTAQEQELYRLNLQTNQTGLLAETSLGATEAFTYAIRKWDITHTNRLTCVFATPDAKEPYRTAWPIEMTCRVEDTRLRATLGNGKGGWTRDIVFWRERDFDGMLGRLRP
jgi:hypothetical protein